MEKIEKGTIMKNIAAKTGILVLKIMGGVCAIILTPLIGIAVVFAIFLPIGWFLYWIGWYDLIERDSIRTVGWIISLIICGVISYRRGYKNGNSHGYAVGQTDGRRGIDYSP